MTNKKKLIPNLCPQCGAALKEGAKRCEYCGVSFLDEEEKHEICFYADNEIVMVEKS